MTIISNETHSNQWCVYKSFNGKLEIARISNSEDLTIMGTTVKEFLSKYEKGRFKYVFIVILANGAGKGAYWIDQEQIVATGLNLQTLEILYGTTGCA